MSHSTAGTPLRFPRLVASTSSEIIGSGCSTSISADILLHDLMDNHQSELGEELATRKHLYCASPQTLHQTIVDMDLNALVPYSPGDATPVAKHINRFLGFPDD
ncbi:UDP-N-acetylglucosamine transferase subunit ALG13 [Trifolium medium]|uniref:UDP-N-acetylglucosamine transferase subunit ALG13 n=1 Tax=Trifolium medium TaxID=97028 RepID=A0A392M7T9_9FABA|nr:UDP-N-acetylglucosamine transferase subunit ALG13 [Trifolium medium]